MNNTITFANIVEIGLIQEFISEKLLTSLLRGDFRDFEETLSNFVKQFHNYLADYLIKSASNDRNFKAAQRQFAHRLGLTKLIRRTCQIQISTGYYVNYKGYYAQKVPVGYVGERHVSYLYFKIVGGASPIYLSRVSQLSVMTPSFAIGSSISNNLGCDSLAERNRQLSLTMGTLALSNRAQNMIAPNETVANKRVIIGIDGGRTRTRVWQTAEETQEMQETQSGQVPNHSNYDKFSTPWVEPKLLVISIIDEQGKVSKTDLPIYDVCFGDDEIFELLADYLTLLDITKALCVQVVADGALWIWNRVRNTLQNLGVSPDKIVETLDYYHAMEHLSDLTAYLPKQLTNMERTKTVDALKTALFEGDIPQMKSILQEKLPEWDEKPLKPFDYFEKNQSRMKYADYKMKQLPIGSGIVESAIRRVINLRFKSPSSFWCKDNLQPLFFLRAAFLAGRWNILLDNICRT